MEENKDPFELQEGEQAWADPSQQILKAEDAEDTDSAEDLVAPESEEEESEETSSEEDRAMPKLAGLSVVW